MNKIFKLLLVALSSLIIVGCVNNTEEAKDSSIQSPIEEEVTDSDEDLNQEDEEDVNSTNDTEDEADSTLDHTDAGDNLLSIGEKGVIETALGHYEITPTGIRFEEEMKDEDPYQSPDNGVFIIIDVTMTNIGDKTLVSDEVITARLHNEDGSGGMSNYEFQSINNFKEELDPGESYSGELLFDYSKEDTYQFSFGSAHLDSLSNEVRWEIDSEEAE